MYPVLYKISNDSKLFLYILNSMRLVWEEIDEATIDMDEVDKLFCKPPSEASQKASKTRAKSPAKQVSPIVPQVVKKGTQIGLPPIPMIPRKIEKGIEGA